MNNKLQMKYLSKKIKKRRLFLWKIKKDWIFRSYKVLIISD